jgi:hypothetical protein
MPNNNWGGKRKGAGRPKGSKNKEIVLRLGSKKKPAKNKISIEKTKSKVSGIMVERKKV